MVTGLKGWLDVRLIDVFAILERSAFSVSQPINMPNRSSDLTSAYVDSHGTVFSPKSTDPTNLGVNMCINILEGDNSPRVKDSVIKDVSQRLHDMKLNVSAELLMRNRFFQRNFSI